DRRGVRPLGRRDREAVLLVHRLAALVVDHRRACLQDEIVERAPARLVEIPAEGMADVTRRWMSPFLRRSLLGEVRGHGKRLQLLIRFSLARAYLGRITSSDLSRRSDGSMRWMYRDCQEKKIPHLGVCDNHPTTE